MTIPARHLLPHAQTVPRHKLLEVQLDQNMLGDVPLDSLLRRLLSPSILRLNLSRNYDLGAWTHTFSDVQ